MLSIEERDKPRLLFRRISNAAFKQGTYPTVQLLIDGTDANSATVLGNMAKSLNVSFLQRNGLAQSSPPLVSLQRRLWFNPGLSNPIYFGTGALGMVLALFPALLGALATAREYEMGNIIQAYASSLTGFQWLIGKSLPYIILGFVELVICFAFGMAFYSYRIPTDPAVMLVATFFYLIAGVFLRHAAGQCYGHTERCHSGRANGGVSALAAALGVPVPGS